jgi:hypothetical protein
MSFAKIDCGILDSSIWFDRDARDIFITAILMAEPREYLEPVPEIAIGSLELTGWEAPPGWYGFVKAAAGGIIDRAKLDRASGTAALIKCTSPDLESRSLKFDGRRMIRVEGGFIVLNFKKYRDKDHTAAERQRRLRSESADRCHGNSSVTTVTSGVTERDTVTDRDMSRYVTEAEADTDTESEEKEDLKIPLSPLGGKTRKAREKSTAGVCPDQLVPTEATLAVAAELRTDWSKHFARMRDWSQGNGKKKADWQATLRNWMRNNPGEYQLRDPPTVSQSRSIDASTLGVTL